MNRLVHSDVGFWRSLQISDAQFFAFVEGGLDRPFVDRVAGHALSGSNVVHRVVASKELPGGTGGKVSLLSLFKEMRRMRRLDCVSFGKRMVSLFFADKDVDDVRNSRLKSPHVVYTSTYDLEGHLFDCGDLTRAIADACGVTFDQAAAALGSQKHWVAERVANWKEWMILCIISQTRQINCGCTFARPSDINADFFQPTDIVALNIYKAKLQVVLGLSSGDFDRVYSAIESKVNRSIAAREPLRFFKGKWLKALLERHLSTNLLAPDVIKNGIGDRVASTLVAQVGVTAGCACCAPFQTAIAQLTAKLS